MAEALKDRYFQKPFFERLSSEIALEYSQFPKEEFYSKVFDQNWPDLPLKEMLMHAAAQLRECLPKDYLHVLDILKKICHKFGDFDAMIFPDVVRQFGLDNYADSMEALELFTQYSTAEFAIRPFILKYEDETMQQMLLWSKHKNEHLRRLSSEGCRPRLPWAVSLPRFKQDPSLILPVLENLKEDPSLYVRKSVANNWNDITKDNPDVVLDRFENWRIGAIPETQWIMKHALRGLLKAGHPGALALMGYETVTAKILGLELSSANIGIGQKIGLSFTLKNECKERADFMVDYIVHFNKANGKTAPKVFKLKALQLGAGESIDISKSHDFKLINTRKYYPGTHAIQIQVNGNKMDRVEFELL